jgi:hypothetical protein
MRAAQYLDGFAAGVSSKPQILHGLSLSLTFELLRRYPALLASTEVWRRSADQQLAIAGYISSLHNVPELARSITEAVLSMNAWPALATVIAKFGYEAVAAVLEWVDHMPQTELSLAEPLLGALDEQRNLLTEVVKQKSLGPSALYVVSTLLDPRADIVRALGTKVWVGLVGQTVHLASANAEVRSKAFLLSVGLSLPGQGDVQLVRRSIFDGVRSRSYRRPRR